MSGDLVVSRHALEDAEERKLRTKAEPLVAQLRPGTNFLEPADFLLVIGFFSDSIDDTEEVTQRGRVVLFRCIELVRVPVGSLLTITQLAELAGVHRTTALRWAHTTKVPFCYRGTKKLYNIHGLQIDVCNWRE